MLGSIASLWRYPVKSMQGEELTESRVTERGLAGDRAYGLRDRADGKIATAKNPRKWPTLFGYHAALGADGRARITLPDGSVVVGGEPGVDGMLSRLLGREVALEKAGNGGAGAEAEPPKSEAYWPDIEGLEQRDTVTSFALPEGTFFDCAPVHVLTTATLERLRELYPEGRFATPRFRPNLIVSSAPGASGFVENDWIGKTLAVGDEVRFAITAPAGRCVMTTLPQRDLPRDIGILKTIMKENGGAVGVYASVTRGGIVRRGDSVRLV
jgi:uncharacterized protein YcbX